MGIKKISIKEFRAEGYLQELNRNFLHPLGMALEVDIDKEGTEKLGGIWDYREDPEGMYRGIKDLTEDKKNDFCKRFDKVKKEWDKKIEDRKRILGFGIEPIDEQRRGVME